MFFHASVLDSLVVDVSLGTATPTAATGARRATGTGTRPVPSVPRHEVLLPGQRLPPDDPPHRRLRRNRAPVAAASAPAAAGTCWGRAARPASRRPCHWSQ